MKLNYIFIPIHGFPGYFICELGVIINKTGHVMAQNWRGSKGGNYLYVSFMKKGDKKVYKRSVHILTAQHFIPNPEKKKYVNHKRKNLRHNGAHDLEWCTHSENMKHRNSFNA